MDCTLVGQPQVIRPASARDPRLGAKLCRQDAHRGAGGQNPFLGGFPGQAPVGHDVGLSQTRFSNFDFRLIFTCTLFTTFTT